MKHIRRSFTSMFSRNARGHQVKLEEKLPEEELHPCPHDSYCFILQQSNREHCSEYYALHCGQPMKFYNKWKEQGNQLGVGS